MRTYPLRSRESSREERLTTFEAVLKFAGLENGVPDSAKHKSISLRLLPIKLAAEDSLRLLLILTLINGVFESHIT